LRLDTYVPTKKKQVSNQHPSKKTDWLEQ